jgi:RNA polymerase sigma factor (sigma-70 family)
MEQADAVARLVGRARRGDEAAWNDLVERFLPLVSALIARARLRGPDADDVNQTVWLRLVEHLDDIREPRALAGWIATTTRNECLRVFDHSRRTVAIDPQATSHFDGSDEGHELVDDLLVLERQQALRAALSELPADRRELLRVLLVDPPLSYREISRRLDIPVGSIGPTRARALDQLRNTRAMRGFLEGAASEQRR